MTTKDELRRRAEEIVREKAALAPTDQAAMSPEAAQALHELAVHQIELEMQNEELRHAQAELEAARARYFDLYDLAPVSYLTIGQNGLILEANLTAASLFGVVRNELARQPFHRFILPGDQGRYNLLCKQLANKEVPQACDLGMLKLDGTIFWAHLTATLTRNADNEPEYHVVLSDITQRILAEVNLRKSEEELRATIAQSMDGIVIADGDSRIIEWNDAQTAIFGHTREEMLGKRLDHFQYILLPEEERTPEKLQVFGDLMFDYTQLSSSEIKRARFEYVAEVKDGQRKTIEASFFQINIQDEIMWGVISRDVTERIRAEEALRQSEVKFRSIFEQSRDGIVILNEADGIVDANDAYCQLLGYTRDEILNLTLNDLVVPERRGAPGTVVRAELAHAGKTFETIDLHRDGRHIPVEVTTTALMGINLAVGVVRDITERKQAEESLRQSEAQYRLLAENMSDTVWLVDINLHTIYSSPSVTRLHGNTLEEINTLPLGQQMTADSLQLAMSTFADALSPTNLNSPQPRLNYTIELEFCRKDGSHFWTENTVTLICDSSRKPVNILGSGRDVTARKQAEEALAREAALLSRTEAISHLGSWYIDLKTGKVTWSNGMYRIYNINRSEFNHDVLEMIALTFPSDDVTKLYELYAAIMQDGQPKQFDYQINGGDGSLRWVRAHGELVRDKTGEVIALEGYAQDITERKQVEDALAREAAMLVRAETISHVGSWRLDLSTRTVTGSDEMYRILGLAPTSLPQELGTVIAMAVNPKDREKLSEMIMAVMRKEQSQQLDFQVLQPNGTPRWIHAQGQPECDETGQVVALEGFAQDITERKQAEDELRQSEQRFRLIAETVTEIFWMSDIHSGAMSYVSPGYEQVWGRSTASLYETKQSFLDTLYAEDRERVIADLEVQQEGLPFDHEYRIVRPDGEIRWIWDRGFPVQEDNGPAGQYVGIARDITDRKLAQEALSDSQWRLQNIIEAANVGTWERNVETREMVINDVLAQISGYTLQEAAAFTYDTWASFIHPDYLAEAHSLLAKHFAGDSAYYDYEYRTKHKDGHWVWVNDRGRVTKRTSDGRPLLMFGTQTDITARKQAETEIVRNETWLRGLASVLQYQVESTREFLDKALREAVQLTASSVGFIDYYDEAQQRFVPAAVIEDIIGEFAFREPIQSYTLDNSGIWGEAVRQRRPIIINDAQAVQQVLSEYPEGDGKLARYMTVPVFEGNRIVALVGVANKQTGYDLKDVLQLSLLMGAVWKSVDIKKSEEALRESENKYRLLVNTSCEAIIVTQGPLFRFVNRATLGLLAVDSEYDLIDKPYREYVHPDDYDNLLLAAEQWVSTNDERPQSIFRVIGRDGKVKWVEDNAVRIEWEGKPAFLNIFTDITDRIQAEETLRESEQQYRLLADNMHDAVWLMDMKLHTIYISPSVTKRSGYTQDEINAVPLEQQMTPDSYQRAMALFATALSAEQSGQQYPPTALTIELEYYHKDGSHFWREDTFTAIRDETGKPINILGNGRDITERKRVEEALRQSEEQYRLLADNMTDTLWLMDLNFKTVYISPSVTRLHGYTLEEFNQLTLAQHLTAESYQRAMALFARAAAPENLTRQQPHLTNSAELECICKDGSSYWSEVKFMLILDKAGKLVNILASGRDVTARKQAEEIAKREQALNEAIIEGIPGAFYMLDENGRYVRWNAYQRDEIIGKPDEQVLGMDALDTVYPDDRTLIESRIENVIKNGAIETVEGRVLLRGGPASRWLLMSGRQLLIDGQIFLVGVGTDITERRQAEDAVHERNAELERFNKVTVDREMRMIALKREINQLLIASGEPPRYKIVDGKE
ncbi:MAG: PAS domain S-box protein [Anaerolineae bacterium]